MAAMGVGTIWALLILGMTGHMIKAKWKRWGAVLIGILLAAMGTWTILRKAQVLPPIPGLHMPEKHAVMGRQTWTTEMIYTSGVGKSPDLAVSSAGCANSTEAAR